MDQPNNAPTPGRPKAGRLAGGVLVIDDDAPVREVTRLGLESMGCHVFATDSGAEGIELYCRHRDEIDAVIVDVQMPVMSGTEVFRELVVINPDVKVVMTSGYGEENMMEKFSEAQPAGFLGKPYRMTELFAVMQGVLGQTGDGEAV